DRGQVWSDVEGDDLAAPLRQWDRELTGPAADLQYTSSRLDPGELGEIFDKFRGVAPSGPVVELGRLVEHRAQLLPARFRHVSWAPPPPRHPPPASRPSREPAFLGVRIPRPFCHRFTRSGK